MTVQEIVDRVNLIARTKGQPNLLEFMSDSSPTTTAQGYKLSCAIQVPSDLAVSNSITLAPEEMSHWPLLQRDMEMRTLAGLIYELLNK